MDRMMSRASGIQMKPRDTYMELDEQLTLKMAELQNILQRANQIETEITNHYGKLKTVRKLHESLESLNKKNATMQFKKAKELKRARKLESGESELSLERKEVAPEEKKIYDMSPEMIDEYNSRIESIICRFNEPRTIDEPTRQEQEEEDDEEEDDDEGDDDDDEDDDDDSDDDSEDENYSYDEDDDTMFSELDDAALPSRLPAETYGNIFGGSDDEGGGSVILRGGSRISSSGGSKVKLKGRDSSQNLAGSDQKVRVSPRTSCPRKTTATSATIGSTRSPSPTPSPTLSSTPSGSWAMAPNKREPSFDSSCSSPPRHQFLSGRRESLVKEPVAIDKEQQKERDSEDGEREEEEEGRKEREEEEEEEKGNRREGDEERDVDSFGSPKKFQQRRGPVEAYGLFLDDDDDLSDPPTPPSRVSLGGGEEHKLNKSTNGEGEGEEKDEEDEEDVLDEDWNSRFQDSIEKLNSASEDRSVSLETLMNANLELLHLSQDFIYCAKTYGKIIISEVYLKPSKKTVKPISLGGQAGGEKYIANNILFKFAVDSHGLFSGSDYAAAKVAGHELKGLKAYFSLGMTEIRVPIMALVDYRGFRLIALSVLPVSGKSLVYGSKDAGYTVKKSNKEFNRLMKTAGKRLNLKPHTCGTRPNKTKTLWAACDVEGHLGLDDKFYLLDFSRTLPPVQPAKKEHYNGHLYRMFRKEFVEQYPIPLCSDAYSGFIINDPYYSDHNRHIREATDYLLGTVAKKAARRITESTLEAEAQSKLKSLQLTELMHKESVNMRYLGKIVEYVRPEQFMVVKQFLLMEAVARVMKMELRQLLREKMKELKVPLEVPYRTVVVNYLNLCFGNGPKTKEYWETDVTDKLSRFFNFTELSFSRFLVTAKTEEGEEKPFSAAKVLGLCEPTKPSGDSSISWRGMILDRLSKMMGLHLTQHAVSRFMGTSEWNPDSPVELLDIVEIGERVKHTNVVANAEGFFFQYQAVHMEQSGYKVALLAQAMERFEEALSSSPNDVQGLLNCALTYYHYLVTNLRSQIEEGGNKEANMEEVYLSTRDLYVIKTDELFSRALLIEPKNVFGLCSYALFLVRCGRFERAEEYFIRCLELDPDYGPALREYGNFLVKYGRAGLGRKLIARLVDLGQLGKNQKKQSMHSMMYATAQALNTEVTSMGVFKIYSSDATYKAYGAPKASRTDQIIDVLSREMTKKGGFEMTEENKAEFCLFAVDKTLIVGKSKWTDTIMFSAKGRALNPDEHPYHVLETLSPNHILVFIRSMLLQRLKKLGSSTNSNRPSASLRAVPAPSLVEEKKKIETIKKSENIEELRESLYRPQSYQKLRELLEEGKEAASFKCPSTLLTKVAPPSSYICQMLEGVTVGAKEMREAAIAPATEDKLLWKIAGLLIAGNLTMRMYSLFSPLCTCPVMDISPTIKFTWDANKIVRSVQVNASSWVTCLSNWVQELMEGLDEFVANQGKGGFLSGSTIGGREKGPMVEEQTNPTIEMIFRRLFRVIAHLHFRHTAHAMELFMEDWIAFLFSFMFHFCVYNGIKMEPKVLPCLRALRLKTSRFVDQVDQERKEQFAEAVPCFAGRQKLLNILLNDHIPQLTDLRDSVNESDLMLVIEYGSSQAITMCQESVSPEVLNYQDQCGWTPLIFACLLGRIDIVYYLVMNPKVDVKMSLNDGTTALMFLVCHIPAKDEKEILTIIMDKMKERNLNVNAQNIYGETALHFAARYRNLYAIDYLVTLGADGKAVTILTESSPAHYAFRRTATSMNCQNLADVVKFSKEEWPWMMEKEDVVKVCANSLWSELQLNSLTLANQDEKWIVMMRRQDEIKPRPFVFDLPGIDRSSISDAPSSPNRWQKIGLKLKRATDEAVPIEENAQDIVDKLFAKSDPPAVVLHMAISENLSPQVIAVYLDAIGYDTVLTSCLELLKTTPLHIVIEAQKYIYLPLFLEKFTPIVRPHDEWTPLHCACDTEGREAYQICLDILKKSHKDVRKKGKDDGFTPLHLLCRNQSRICGGTTKQRMFDLLKEMEAAGADLNAVCAHLKNTPLHYAINSGQTKITIWLLLKEADPNIQNIEGNTPLHELLYRDLYRGKFDSMKVIEHLSSHGADWRILNQNKMTPRKIVLENRGVMHEYLKYLPAGSGDRRATEMVESSPVLRSRSTFVLDDRRTVLSKGGNFSSDFDLSLKKHRKTARKFMEKKEDKKTAPFPGIRMREESAKEKEKEKEKEREGSTPSPPFASFASFRKQNMGFSSHSQSQEYISHERQPKKLTLSMKGERGEKNEKGELVMKSSSSALLAPSSSPLSSKLSPLFKPSSPSSPSHSGGRRSPFTKPLMRQRSFQNESNQRPSNVRKKEKRGRSSASLPPNKRPTVVNTEPIEGPFLKEGPLMFWNPAESTWESLYFVARGADLLGFLDNTKMVLKIQITATGTEFHLSNEKVFGKSNCVCIFPEKKSENYLSASSSEDAGEWIKILTEMSKERKGSRVRVERVESGVGEDGGGEEGRVQKKKKLSLEDLRTIKRYYDEENPNPSQQQIKALCSQLSNPRMTGKVGRWFKVQNELTGHQSPTLSGYLLKKGENRRNWQKRWFVLYSRYLLYYETNEALLLKGQIALHGSTVQICQNPRITEKYPLAFTLSTPERTYYMNCQTEMERDKWIAKTEDFCISRRRMTLNRTQMFDVLDELKTEEKKREGKEKKREEKEREMDED